MQCLQDGLAVAGQPGCPPAMSCVVRICTLHTILQGNLLCQRQLQHIRCPVACIHGRQDELVPPAKVEATLQQLQRPLHFEVIDKCAHLVLQSKHTDAACDKIVIWIQKLLAYQL